MLRHNGFCSKATKMMLFALLTATLIAQSGRHLIKKIPVPGDYGWDYLTADTEGRRLYVSHDREVVVLDLDSAAIIGKIPGSDVHGIAVVRDLGRGFISATDPGSVTIFDLKTLAVIDKVPVGEDPNAIFYDRKTKRVFTIDRVASASARSIRRPAKLSEPSKVWEGGRSMRCLMTLGTCF